MPTISKNQGFLIVAISLLMLLTRGAHFSGFNALPEASWMIFMVAGVLLPTSSFAWFMSLAIGIDAYAFTFGGVPGLLLYRLQHVDSGVLLDVGCWSTIEAILLTGESAGFAVFFGLAIIGTFVCELISSGSFYLWSGNFEPTLAEFVSRELTYAPAAFSSSAYWAVAFILSSVYLSNLPAS